MRMRVSVVLVLLCAATAFAAHKQSPQPAAKPAGDNVWAALSNPVADPARFARVENVEVVRDRVHITLRDGTIQFLQPTNGVVFGAVFHGNGRIAAEPPNAVEAQQLQLFIKQTTLNAAFTDATFSFADGLFEEISKQVH